MIFFIGFTVGALSVAIVAGILFYLYWEGVL